MTLSLKRRDKGLRTPQAHYRRPLDPCPHSLAPLLTAELPTFPRACVAYENTWTSHAAFSSFNQNPLENLQSLGKYKLSWNRGKTGDEERGDE